MHSLFARMRPMKSRGEWRTRVSLAELKHQSTGGTPMLPVYDRDGSFSVCHGPATLGTMRLVQNRAAMDETGRSPADTPEALEEGEDLEDLRRSPFGGLRERLEEPGPDRFLG